MLPFTIDTSASTLWNNSYLLTTCSPNAHVALASNSLHPVPAIEEGDVKKVEFLNLRFKFVECELLLILQGHILTKSWSFT